MSVEEESARSRLRRAADRAKNSATGIATSSTQSAAKAAGAVGEHARHSAEKVAKKAAEAKAALPQKLRRSSAEVVDLSALDKHVKLLYCRVLIGVAAVDGSMDPREVANLYLFMSTISAEVDTRGELRFEIARARDAASEPSTIEAAQELWGQLEEDRETVFTMLLKDLVRTARADGDAAQVERSLIESIAQVAFGGSAGKAVEGIEELVSAEEQFASGKLEPSKFEKTTKDIVAKGAAFGVPLAAVNVVGVSGLGAAGLTSGLAALGFGGVLGLSAMVTGIGTVVILGVVAYQGTRYVLGTSEREKSKRRENLIQEVIKNHQAAIADLSADIAGLAERMEGVVTNSAGNEERLARLRAELDVFQQALEQLQSSKHTFDEAEPSHA